MRKTLPMDETAAGQRAALVRAALVRELARGAASDLSLIALVVANVAALVVAYIMKMGLRDLMLVYWIQSVVIGVCNVIRIVRLRQFDTEGFRINGRPAAETLAAKLGTAMFFAMHYGFFHLVYLIFILAAPVRGGGQLAPLYVYAGLALLFAVNHGYSLRHNMARDALGKPNLGTLMFLPYARILPMHLTIVLGGAFTGGTFAFFLFGLLKTFADVLMHAIEHFVLGNARRKNKWGQTPIRPASAPRRARAAGSRPSATAA